MSSTYYDFDSSSQLARSYLVFRPWQPHPDNRGGGRNSALSSLNAAREALKTAKERMGMTPATVAFGSTTIVLTAIRVGLLPVRLSRLLANVHRTR